MELENKRINFLGDSITEGYLVSSNDKCYVSIIGKLTGACVRNYGICGTRIANQPFEQDGAERRCFGSRIDEMQDADIVVVFGGTNDYGHGMAKLGKFDSRDDFTFYGALHNLCIKLINKFPESEIVFITPLHRLNENAKFKSTGQKNETDLAGYCEIIKEVAGYYGFPVLDLFKTGRMQPNVEITNKLYFVDGLHPNDKGHEYLAQKIIAFLENL